MSHTKKHSPDWYVAATHYLTSGFAIPFLGSILIGTLHEFFLPYEGAAMSVLVIIESVVLTYAGVLYGSKYVLRTYEIRDRARVIKLATIYYVVVMLSIWVATLSAFNGYSQVESTQLGLGALSALLNVFVFYFASREYLGAHSS